MYIIGAWVALVVILLLFALIQNTAFRFVSSDPKKTIPYSVTQVTFTFSKDLDPDTYKNASVSPKIAGRFAVQGKNLVFLPAVALQKGDITFTFKDITAKNGQKINHLEKTFTVDYVEYQDLSEEEQRRQVIESSGGQDRFDILNGHLPHASYNYTLDYSEPEPSDTHLYLMVDVYGKSNDETEQQYIQRMEQARKDMLQYVEKHRGKNTIDDFYFVYNNDYLSQYDVYPPDAEEH